MQRAAGDDSLPTAELKAAEQRFARAFEAIEKRTNEKRAGRVLPTQMQAAYDKPGARDRS